MTIHPNLIKARAALVASRPFYGALALRLTFEEVPWLPTMATDTIKIYYSHSWVDKLTVPELTGVIAHEILHIAAGHPWRVAARDKELFNIACDYAINPLIIEDHFTLPKGGLNDPQYKDMHAEEIYSKLQALPKTKITIMVSTGSGGGKGSDPGQCGAFMGPPGNQGGAEQAQAEGEWKIATAQAAQFAKAAGKLPAHLERLVAELGKPKVDWKAVLRRFITTSVPSDYRWMPPNRRYLSQGIYLPSLQPDRIGEIVVAIDTSGSISNTQLAAFSTELNSICDDARPSKVWIIYCDAAVNHVDEFDFDQFPIVLKPHGGGGTAFRPVFEYVEKHGIEPICLIFMTDLMGDGFNVEQSFSTLWACTNDQIAPFGETVHIDAV